MTLYYCIMCGVK